MSQCYALNFHGFKSYNTKTTHSDIFLASFLLHLLLCICIYFRPLRQTIRTVLPPVSFASLFKPPTRTRHASSTKSTPQPWSRIHRSAQRWRGYKLWTMTWCVLTTAAKIILQRFSLLRFLSTFMITKKKCLLRYFFWLLFNLLAKCRAKICC